MVLIDLVNILFNVLYLLLLIRVILSWVPGAFDHPAGVAIVRLTNPILDPLRRILPPVAGFDLSPLVAFLLLGLIRPIILELLVRALGAV